MQIKYIKEIGIVASYLWLLIAVYFFDWQPLSIFVSFLAELAIIFFAYWFLLIFSSKKNRRNQPGGNVLMAGIAMIGFQYFLISILATSIGWNQFLHNSNLTRLMTSVSEHRDFMLDPYFILNANYAITFGMILLLYILRLSKIKKPEQREQFAQENLFIQVLILSGMNVIGFLVSDFFTILSPFPMLVIMVGGRIFMELYINHWNKKQI